MMDNGDSGGGTIGDTFLASSGQYIVHADDEDLAITGDSGDQSDGHKDSEPLREQVRQLDYTSFIKENDRFLPIANVARIMKNAIPKTGKIAKDAKECVQECVSEFVSFITSEASDRCHQEKRKTINGEDILFAMSTLGFDNYVEPLKLYLQKYREGEKNVSTSQAADGTLEELEEHSFSNILSSDGTQQNVIYTTAYPGQIHFG